MARRKKKIKNAKKPDTNNKELARQIKKVSEDLYYISETDAEIFPFIGNKAEAITGKEVLKQIKSSAETPVEERDFTEFFAYLTQIQDWFGNEEKTTAQKFSNLKDLLEKNLKNLKVFKVGKIQLDIYVVGLDAESNLMGIQTKAVET
ncbi:MAG: nuclease A inhibitor family protein [Acidobacteria bacterium]|nr:nuclease A inhibitor family protein [Acidobacteriota bacterium]